MTPMRFTGVLLLLLLHAPLSCCNTLEDLLDEINRLPMLSGNDA